MAGTVFQSPSDTTQSWIAVSALFLAAFLSLLDVTVVNLAMPSIVHDLGASDTQAQWMLLAYLVPFASALLTFGRFGDALGRRRLFAVGISGFAMGAFVAGMADSTVVFLVARVAQGFSAAAMMPQVLALTHVILPPELRPRAMGYFGMVSAMGAVAGPVVGGVVLAADFAGLGWRMVFLMTIPACLASLGAIMVLLEREPIQSLSSLDVRSGVWAGVAIALLIFPIVQGRSLGWPFWAIALIPVTCYLGARVIRDQLHAEASTVAPLLPAELLRSATFMQGVALVLLLFAGIAGVPFLLALDLQIRSGLSPGDVAMALVAHPLAAVVSSNLAGRIHPANRWITPTIGSLLTLAGILLIRQTLMRAGLAITPADLLLPLSLVGLGMGAATVSLFQNTLSQVPAAVAGAASGALQTGQQIGIAISIAAVGALYFGGVGGSTDDVASVSAAANSLWFPIVLFGTLSILCLSAAIADCKGSAR